MSQQDAQEWKSASKEGDVIKVTLEFIKGKGVLGFSRNDQFLGIICEDIDPPVYPVVEISGCTGCTLIN